MYRLFFFPNNVTKIKSQLTTISYLKNISPVCLIALFSDKKFYKCSYAVDISPQFYHNHQEFPRTFELQQ